MKRRLIYWWQRLCAWLGHPGMRWTNDKAACLGCGLVIHYDKGEPS